MHIDFGPKDVPVGSWCSVREKRGSGEGNTDNTILLRNFSMPYHFAQAPVGLLATENYIYI
jgi:hypothetical protein